MPRALAGFDAWQRRHPPVAFPLAVVKKFVDDRASGLAALIAYYAFLSLFPLLLALVSVLGFLLHDNPSLQDDILDTALGRIPVIGEQLRDDVQSLTGSGVALVVGLAGALWAGLGITLALGRAFDEVWDVPRVAQPGALKARARGMVVLAGLGVALIAASLSSGLAVGGAVGPLAEQLAALAASLVVDALVYFAVFWLLTAPPRRARHLLPGVALAAGGSLLLQSAGGWYVEHAIANASPTYGTFALVIGLLSWFWLVAHLLLVGAEVNVVVHRRLWPRSLSGDLEPADRLALQASAAAIRQDARQRITVGFNETPSAPAEPSAAAHDAADVASHRTPEAPCQPSGGA